MKPLAAGLLAAAALALAGGALSAGSFSDPPGDDNAAPDITSVSVSESSPGVVTVAVTTTSSELALPRNAWFNLWFEASIVGGSGRCSFVVPATAAGKTVRGSITVRASGKSVTARFAYAVR